MLSANRIVLPLTRDVECDGRLYMEPGCFVLDTHALVGSYVIALSHEGPELIRNAMAALRAGITRPSEGVSRAAAMAALERALALPLPRPASRPPRLPLGPSQIVRLVRHSGEHRRPVP